MRSVVKVRHGPHYKVKLLNKSCPHISLQILSICSSPTQVPCDSTAHAK